MAYTQCIISTPLLFDQCQPRRICQPRVGLHAAQLNPVLGLMNAASSAIASAPALILQRASPRLYEFYQQLLSYANASVSLATKSCEQMRSDIVWTLRKDTGSALNLGSSHS